jgi:glutamine synthetase
MGTELIEAFTILKRGEWERYMGANQETDTTEVTDWELRYYLPYH